MQSAWILKTSKPQNIIVVKTDFLFCSYKKKSVYLPRKARTFRLHRIDWDSQHLIENRESRTAQWRADMHSRVGSDYKDGEALKSYFTRSFIASPV